MAARHKSHRRWFLRDVPRTYMMLVWLAFCLTVIVYLNDWHPSGWSALRPQQAATPKPQRTDAEIYTGSLIIVPAVGEKCQQLMIDNRTGKMWDKGTVNCYEATSPPERDPNQAISSKRINAIGNAFRGGSE
jgi:hypothetical protein